MEFFEDFLLQNKLCAILVVIEMVTCQCGVLCMCLIIFVHAFFVGIYFFTRYLGALYSGVCADVVFLYALLFHPP